MEKIYLMLTLNINGDWILVEPTGGEILTNLN